MKSQLPPIIIFGLPRSGSTWFGKVLSSAHNTHYIFEPDNEALSPIAWVYKKNLHRYPYLTKFDNSKEYKELWSIILNWSKSGWYANAAFGLAIRRTKAHSKELESWVGDKTGLRYLDSSMHHVGQPNIDKPFTEDRHRFVSMAAKHLSIFKNITNTKYQTIIKSVHSHLCMEWLIENFAVSPILLLRNPFSIYASYKRLLLPDGYRNPLTQETLIRDINLYMLGHDKSSRFISSNLDLIPFQIMLMYKIIENQVNNIPQLMIVSHDKLCLSPHQDYKNIFENLNLSWSNTTNKVIDELNKPGKGFDPKRISKDQPLKWKKEITKEEELIIEKWIDIFNLSTFFKKYVYIT